MVAVHAIRSDARVTRIERRPRALCTGRLLPALAGATGSTGPLESSVHTASNAQTHTHTHTHREREREREREKGSHARISARVPSFSPAVPLSPPRCIRPVHAFSCGHLLDVAISPCQFHAGVKQQWVLNVQPIRGPFETTVRWIPHSTTPPIQRQ
jgi:hypothetical protein